MFIPMKTKLRNDLSKKNQLDFSHMSSATAPFGVLFPLVNLETDSDSDYSLNLNQFVRLAPMPTPTFGRVSLRNYIGFVPYSEICPQFKNLIAGKSIRTSQTQYIPKNVPYVTASELFMLLYFKSELATLSVYAQNKDAVIVDRHIQFQKMTDPVSAFNVFKKCHPFKTSHLTVFNSTIFTQVNFNALFSFADNEASSIPSDADFVFYGKDSTTNTTYIFCWRLSRRGRYLKSILDGSRLVPSVDSSQRVNILSLLAFYKLYFDLFAVKRHINWTDTICHKFIHYLMDYGIEDITSNAETIRLFSQFVSNLSEPYYSADPDFYLSHLTTQSLESSANTVPYMQPYSNTMATTYAVKNDPNTQATTQVGNSNNNAGIDRVRMLLINALAKRINKNTAFGGRVDELLKKLYNWQSVGDNNSNYIGSCVVPCEISDVMSNNQSDDVFLGEYAGKGIGASRDNHFSYHANEPGQFIILSCIVPEGRFCQGSDLRHAHVGKYDFFTPEFDGVSMVSNPASIINPVDDYYGVLPSAYADFVHSDSAFGMMPRYSETKFLSNTLIGNFRLRSTRNALLPYTLDRIIYEYEPECEILPTPQGEPKRILVGDFEQGIQREAITSVDDLRYLSKFDRYADFNRIFWNHGSESKVLASGDYQLPIDDNFIIHNNIVLKCFTHKLPLSESFDTDGIDSGISTEKA